MNYERNANEVFDGGHQSFSGKKILLGITNDNKVRTMKSPKSKYVAFKTGGDLWCYCLLYTSVSKKNGRCLNSGCVTIRLNVSNPIYPSPNFACLSLCAPIGFWLSFKCMAFKRFNPILLSNSVSISSK